MLNSKNKVTFLWNTSIVIVQLKMILKRVNESAYLHAELLINVSLKRKVIHKCVHIDMYLV